MSGLTLSLNGESNSGSNITKVVCSHYTNEAGGIRTAHAPVLGQHYPLDGIP
jgi:hypothetical protein